MPRARAPLTPRLTLALGVAVAGALAAPPGWASPAGAPGPQPSAPRSLLEGPGPASALLGPPPVPPRSLEPAPAAPLPAPLPKRWLAARWTGGVLAGLGALTTAGGLVERSRLQSSVEGTPLSRAQQQADGVNTALVAGQVAVGLGASVFGLSFIGQGSGAWLRFEVKE